MRPPDTPSLSRRRLLRSAAGLGAASVGLAARTAASAEAELSVLTRNLYVGVDLSRLFEVSDVEGLRPAAGEILAEVERHPYDARTDAMAAEIEATEPDAVCVQEAALIRTREPSAFDGDHDPGAETVRVDLLASLAERLRARGLDYAVASSIITNDIEVPADTEDAPVDLRLTNRVAVLVHGDLAVDDTGSALYDAGVPIPLEDVDLTIRRGYATATVALPDRPVTVASTHLESFVAGIRDAQARELDAALSADRPVVVGGDLNTGPATSPDTYEQLREGFEDAHATLRPPTDGHTCCHDDDLRNDAPNLTRRVDAVLHRGGGSATAVGRVGAASSDRVTADVAGETVRVWPSDHAGVAASLTVPPRPAPPTTASTASTASPTQTAASIAPAETPDTRPGDATEPQDGFGVVTAVVAGAAGVIAALRRRVGGEE